MPKRHAVGTAKMERQDRSEQDMVCLRQLEVTYLLHRGHEGAQSRRVGSRCGLIERVGL